jgi:hypothetical protein
LNRTIHNALILFPLLLAGARAQQWDVGARAAGAVAQDTENRLKLSFEQRGRYEDRTGNAFGRDADRFTGLYRTRLGLTYSPFEWLKVSAMVQDARAPWYGPHAPGSVRDPADLQEGYFELFPDKTGFGMAAGRMMLNYGEARLIGSPQWGNVARTYDFARVYRRSAKARFEFLLASPVKVRPAEFNRPVLGDRIWGTYNSFPNFSRNHLLEAYILRHDQNRPGGFTGGSRADGTDRLGVTAFGFRLAGSLAAGLKYSAEGVGEKGKVGSAGQSGGAWFSGVSRRWTVAARALDISAEYKYASAGFDQMYPANHDKFGHEDLFGWRNMHNARALATFALTKSLVLNLMYDSIWLADPAGGIYNSAGSLIARSAAGTAGRHAGQEADIFGAYKYGHFTLGAGYGHFFAGEFIRQATPGLGPTYLYVFHSYSL